MPYSKKNLPNAIKNLPSGAQSIWVDAFNSVYAETKDEDKARKAGWAACKKSYKKVGAKWVRRKEEITEGAYIKTGERYHKIKVAHAGYFKANSFTKVWVNKETGIAKLTAVPISSRDGKRKIYAYLFVRAKWDGRKALGYVKARGISPLKSS